MFLIQQYLPDYRKQLYLVNIALQAVWLIRIIILLDSLQETLRQDAL